MKLTRVRFEGALRFPKVSGDSPTFDSADGFDIETDINFWVHISRGNDSIHVPWQRVMEAVQAPLDLAAYMPRTSFEDVPPPPDETAPQPKRRGRPPKLPAT